MERAAELQQGSITLALSVAAGRLVHHARPPGATLPPIEHPVLVVESHALTSSEHARSSLLLAVDWAACLERYQAAVQHASASLGVAAQAVGGHMRLVDVRRDAAFKAATTCIEGALRRDPADVEQWAQGSWDASTVVVYCVHGHEVSRAVALRLRAHGVPSGFLIGGIEGWRAQGLPLQTIGEQA
jgi:rhodanese-related sulfurtransferase